MKSFCFKTIIVILVLMSSPLVTGQILGGQIVKKKFKCSANVRGTAKEFMCYNLGVTGGTQDPLSYQGGLNNGGLYQWGRTTDGHEVRNSPTTSGPVAAAVAGRFIIIGFPQIDWISPQNNSLWLDASKTANDPCPAGFRVPTKAQWAGLFKDGVESAGPGAAYYNTWTWTGSGFRVGSSLYLPAAGLRLNNGEISGEGTSGFYWSSTVSGTDVYSTNFVSGTIDLYVPYFRANGLSVRCISE